MKNQNDIAAIRDLQVDVSDIEEKHVKQRMLKVALACLAVVSASHVASVIKMVQKRLSDMRDAHPTPDGTDVKSAFSRWNSKQSVAIMSAAFIRFGMDKPSELVKRCWNFATITGAQRSGNDYLALKSQQKLEATCAWLVSNDATVWWNVNKYLVAQITTAEILDINVVANSDIYHVYESNTLRLEALTADIDADLRRKLMDIQLYKSAGTASTQRTTSANILQILDAGVNAGNERCIYFDRESDVYVALRNSLFGVNT